MKFIKPNPSKVWKLLELTEENGNKLYITDYYDIRRYYNDGNCCGWYKYENREKIYLSNVTEVDNFIFHANLMYTGNSRSRSAAMFHFKDADDNNKYNTGMKGLDLILKDVSIEQIKVNGTYSGLWTFAKQGDSIYLMPHNYN